MSDLPPNANPNPESAAQPAPPAYAQQPTYPQQPAPGYAAPGYATPYGQAYAAPAKTNTLAIVSLVLSLIGVGIGGIITGHLALNQIKTSGESGRGLALAGTIIGYVAVGLGIIAIIAYVIFLVAILGAAGAASTFN